MRKTVLLVASVTVALLLASTVTLIAPKERAEAAFPGTNGKIAFLDRDGDNEIYTISSSGGQWGTPKPLTHNDKSDKTPSFSPNGKKIVWESGEYLYLMNADGSNKRRIPNTRHSNLEIGRYGSYGGNPAFSRNLTGGNKKIIFDKNKNIWTINPDGTGLTRITNAAPGGDCRRQTPTFVHPVWSPVSGKISFSYLCGKNRRELHVMALSDLRGKQNLDDTSRLSPAGVDVYRPDWSPDGTKIVYECSEEPCQSGTPRSPNPDIYMVDLNGNNTPLVTNGADDSYPVFSPSGGKVAFSSNRDGDFDLYITKVDGSGDSEQKITFNRRMDIQPDWQPIR